MWLMLRRVVKCNSNVAHRNRERLHTSFSLSHGRKAGISSSFIAKALTAGKFGGYSKMMGLEGLPETVSLLRLV